MAAPPSATAPQCVIEDVTDQFDPQGFDRELGTILVKAEGSSHVFLTTVLGFLKRKSNFFKEPEPKRRLLEALKEVGLRCGWGEGWERGRRRAGGGGGRCRRD